MGKQLLFTATFSVLVLVASACHASKNSDENASSPATAASNTDTDQPKFIKVSDDSGNFTRYKARPGGSKVHIDGSANIHDWSMDGTIIGGWFEVPEGVTIDSSQASITGLSGDKLNARSQVNIPVVSLTSGTAGMDEVMQQAMDAKDHPEIQCKVSEMTLKQPHTAGTPFQFDTKGDLTINGVTKTITMPVTIESVDKTKLKITGGPVDINMTDYKVPPPTKFGVFETRPGVKITFEWVVSLPKKK